MTQAPDPTPQKGSVWLRELSVLVTPEGRRLLFLHFAEKGFARCRSLDSGPPGSFPVKRLREEAEPSAEHVNEWLEEFFLGGRELKKDEAKRAHSIIRKAVAEDPQ